VAITRNIAHMRRAYKFSQPVGICECTPCALHGYTHTYTYARARTCAYKDQCPNEKLSESIDPTARQVFLPRGKISSAVWQVISFERYFPFRSDILFAFAFFCYVILCSEIVDDNAARGSDFLSLRSDDSKIYKEIYKYTKKADMSISQIA